MCVKIFIILSIAINKYVNGLNYILLALDTGLNNIVQSFYHSTLIFKLRMSAIVWVTLFESKYYAFILWAFSRSLS